MSEQVQNYFEAGLRALETGEYSAAVDAFSKALRLSLGDIPEMLIYRGEAFAYMEDWDHAVADFNEALRRDPYLAEAYNQRGNVKRFLGDLQGAIEDQSAAIQISPDHYEAYYNRALAYEMLGELEQAEADFSETIALNPSVAPAYESRGRVRAALKNHDGAIEDFGRYLRMGGGREFDNHSEVQSQIISLRIARFFSRFLGR